MSWQRAYVAVSSLLRSEGSEDATDGLPPEAMAHAEPLVRELKSPDRATRAKALASELAQLARVLEELELGKR